MKISQEEFKTAVAEALAPLVTAETLARQDVCSVEEAARYMRLSTSTLNHWRTEGIGPRYSLICRKVVYRKRDLDDYIAANLKRTRDQQ